MPLDETSLEDLIRQAHMAGAFFESRHDSEAAALLARRWHKLVAGEQFMRSPPGKRAEILRLAGRGTSRCFHVLKVQWYLDATIFYWSRALEVLPDTAPNQGLYRLNLAMAIWSRYEISKDIKDLDQSLDLYREALVAGDLSTTDRVASTNNLGVALAQKFELTRDPASLAERRARCRELLTLLPPSDAHYSTVLTTVAQCSSELFKIRGEEADANEAIAAYERALRTSTFESAEGRIVVQLGLSLAHRAKYDILGDVSDLKKHVKIGQQTLESMQVNGEGWLILSTTLAISYTELADATQDVQALHAAERLWNQRLAAPTPTGLEQHQVALLAQTWRQFYLLTEQTEYLKRAIARLDEAFIQASNNEDRSTIQGRLAECWRDMFISQGNMSHLSKAIDIAEQAARRTNSRWGTASSLNVLGTLQQELAGLSKRVSDATAAVDAHREALNYAQDDSRQGGKSPTAAQLSDARALRVNLAHALVLRAQIAQSVVDVDEAISIMSEIVEAGVYGRSMLASYQQSLSNAQIVRFRLSGATDDLHRALDASQAAGGNLAAAGVLRMNHQVNHATLLAERDRATHTHTHEAQAALESAALSCLRESPRRAILALREWGSYCAEFDQWKQAARAYSLAMDVCRQVVASQVLRDDKTAWLRELQGLPAESASALIRVGDLELALAALEEGRALLLNERLSIARLRLESAGATSGDSLLERFSHEATMAGSHLHPEVVAPEEVNIDPPGQLMRGLGQEAPPLQGLLTSVKPIEIHQRSRIAPIVYVFAGKHGGHALIVRDTVTVAIDLPRLRSDELSDRLNAYFAAFRAGGQTLFGDMDATLEWLWDVAMDDVLAGLTDSPRAIFVPIGMLGFLPLHAAWTKVPGGSEGRKYALDQLSITYAPSARSLVRKSGGVVRESKTLVVGEPSPVSAGPLPFSAWEAVQVSNEFDGAKLLVGNAATRDAVTAILTQEVEVAHFACHAYVENDAPLHSGLLMAHDQRVTMSDLLSLTGRGGRLAVLSACETGFMMPDLPDEAVSIAGSFLELGFGAVVASLWPVPDRSTALLMRRFYHHMLRESMDPASALRAAQQWLRTSAGIEDADEGEYSNLNATVEPSRVRSNLSPYRHPIHWAGFAYHGG